MLLSNIMVISLVNGISLYNNIETVQAKIQYEVAYEYDGKAVYDCVAFVNSIVSGLPSFGYTRKSKERCINSQTPVPGAISIEYGNSDYGHVAYVEKVSGNIITTVHGGFEYTGNLSGKYVNIHKNHAVRKTGTANELGIIGYYIPSNINNNVYTPRGYLDGVTTAPGQITVSGWALDEDAPNKAITVHVYIGDTARQGTTAEVHVISANQYRSDIGQHSFYATLKTNKTGNQNIYVYGINIDKSGKNSGGNPQLPNAKTVNIPPRISYKLLNNQATNIKNKDATISGTISNGGRATSWGFYLGKNSDSLAKYQVSTTSSVNSTISTNIAPYVSLNHGTTYYYRMYAVVDGKEITDSNLKTFTTTSVKPEIPTLKVAGESREIGIGDSADIMWNSVDNADYYYAYLYDADGNLVHKSPQIEGTKYTFPVAETDGEYSATVEAYSDVGTKGKSNEVSIKVHPDVTVVFKDADTFVDVGDDYEPSIISEQTIHWGHSANKPANPSHKGYTFKKWSSDYTNVKEDMVVKATYDINSYKVKFVNSLTQELIDTQVVEYCSSAKDVDYDIATGYVRTGYNGWDKDYTCITEDTTLYTCVGWYNDNFPVYTEIISADREYDAKESDNEGYTIVAKLTSKDAKSNTKGRLVVALKTSAGKLLTTTESAAFLIKKSANKEIEVFVPYNKAATQVEVYVVGQYTDAVPISNSVSEKINQENIYTDWSTERPGEGTDFTNLQSRTEYRYSDKMVTTSYNTSLDGYTQSGSQWVKSGSGAIDYVSSFPSGFNRSSWYYTNYNKTPVTSYETWTTKRNVSTATIGYMYFHWCKNRGDGPNNHIMSDCYEGAYPTFHAFTTSSPISYNSSAGAFYYHNSGVCRDTYWWDATYAWNGTQTPIKRCSYTDYRKLFTYYKWADFSDWSTTQYAKSDNRKVETREVYRWQSNELLQEDNSGKERTVKGTLGAGFANKEATLFIYKVDGASDYTNEYVAQTQLDEQGNYEFTFKLREEPTVKTGDYTVVLGVEGTSTAIYIDTIEAPKNKYTVKFYNYEGKVISEQEVIEGEDAQVPSDDEIMRKGYTFKKWSVTNVNITSDMEIYPEYEINTYDVVFVDWNSNSVTVKKFEYGSPLVAPIAEEPDKGTVVQWEILSGIEEGDDTKVSESTVVTNDLVVGTKNVVKTYEIKIQDDSGNIVDIQEIEYGKAITLPESPNKKDKIFLGWQNTYGGQEAGLENSIVIDNMIICPVYVYSEDVKAPSASVKTGVYDKVQTIELTCESEGVSIYYTTDGTNPKSYHAELYTEPIIVDKSMELKFYATGISKNDSEIITEYYSINLKDAKSKWMPYAELPEEVINNMSEYSVESDTGYAYKTYKSAKTVAEKIVLEEAGWIYDQARDTYTGYSEWTDYQLADTSEYIGVEEETRAVYDQVQKYRYSHYKYTLEGKTYYSATLVDGQDCTYEEITMEDKLLTSGFENKTAYYVYDGQTWYKQTKVVEQTQVGTQYRYKYKVAAFYKWSDYTTEIPSEDEIREYKESDVYSYKINNKYLVTLIDSQGEKVCQLIEEGGFVTQYVADNTEQGYIPDGLYTDVEYKNEWTPETEVLTDTTLYVKESIINNIVTFAYEDGREIECQTVQYGHAAVAPEVEKREGYIFVGWDTDAYKNVKESILVTAKYVAEKDYATVELDNEELVLYVGKSSQLTAIVTPGDYEGELTWSSSDNSVATVSEDGKVTAFKTGLTDITVKVNETGETAKCTVSVKSDLSTTLSLLKNSKMTVDKGYLRDVKAGSNTVREICNDFENVNLKVTNAENIELSDDDVVGTGSTIYLIRNNKVMDTLEVVVSGDVNSDGFVNNKDVSMLVRCLAEKEVPTDSQILAANVNGDGYVNNRDAALIARSLVGKEIL